MSTTILLVEDDERLRNAVRRMLSALGYAAVPAEHGAAALELLDGGGHAIDLVLSDVVMPRMTGIELARELIGRDVAPPIVLMSGFVQEALDRDGGSFPDVPLLAKPFTLDELAAMLESALGTGRVN